MRRRKKIKPSCLSEHMRVCDSVFQLLNKVIIHNKVFTNFKMTLPKRNIQKDV